MLSLSSIKRTETTMAPRVFLITGMGILLTPLVYLTHTRLSKAETEPGGANQEANTSRFLSGTSTGFGHELAKVCLAAGDKVVATARNSSRLSSSFPDSTPDNLLLVDLDVTKRNSIDAAFQAAVDHFGRIDVCVNNAGFGLGGEFEGLAEEQIRMQMEVNFFGVVNVTRKAMETMRDLKTGGVIQQVTSIGGQRGAVRALCLILSLFDALNLYTSNFPE